MIHVKSVSIDDCYGVDFLYITFTVSDMVKPPESYKLDLYRAENQEDFFIMIAEDLDQFRYVDNAVNLLNTNLQYFYRVKITDLDTGEVSTSASYGYKARTPDRWAFAIDEIERKYIENVIDNKMAYLVQKKRTGARCSCWNPNRESVNDQYCELCYGSGFFGGYYNPTPIKIGNYNPSNFQRVYSPTEDGDTITTQRIWVRNFPKVENDDIIVDEEDRYIITSHTDTIKNHHLIRQICTMELLPRTNIIYRFPIVQTV